MTPLQYYQRELELELIKKDSHQLEAMHQLQHIYDALLKQDRSRTHVWSRLKRFLGFNKPVKGLYLWGHIGVGKTFLIDTFYHCLPIKKLRLHFHQFMLNIHDELAKSQGKRNPLDYIAKKFAQRTQVLCFDELIVNNIVDAMVLGNLLKSLFKNGVCLVTSSNTPPDELYKDGLQREAFLPAIAIIKKNTLVVHLPSAHDYRLEHLSQAGVYFSPLTAQAESNMEKSFQHFSNHQPASKKPIQLFNRQINIRKQADKTIWFDFMDLCGVPRSQKDYLALAQQYHTILISNIPIIGPDQNNLITAFIKLIDVLYDARVRLVISAETDVQRLYPEGRMKPDFARAQSRLIEMQTTEYLASR